MKCFIDTHDTNKGSFPEQELTEEQFFEQFAALEDGLALLQIHMRDVRKRQTLRQPRKAHAAINLPHDSISEVRRVTGANMRTTTRRTASWT